MISFKYKLIVFSIILLCTGNVRLLAQSLMQERVKKSDNWSNLFIRENGWFGGDGIFAIPLDGKEFIPASESTKTLFLFSDTMIGTIENNQVKPGQFSMPHNTLAILEGNQPDPDNIEFYWNSDETSAALFFPTTSNAEEKEYYWLGDGFVNTDGDGLLYIFCYRIKNISGGIYPFKQVGVSLIAINPKDNPPYVDNQQFETPFFIEIDGQGQQTTYGSTILVNTKSAGAPNPDGYIYVYGVRGIGKELVVSRVKPVDFSNFSSWTFWDGVSWDSEINRAQSIARNVSNEMSISPVNDGRLMLTYQYMTAEPEIAVQIGRSPVGPFQPMKKIWRTEEAFEDLDFFTYNAKAHPHLSSKGTLLISYNVNSFDFWNDILNKPNLYRPRFIELKLD